MNDGHREAIRIINHYIYGGDTRVVLNTDSLYFTQRSYSISAGKDLIDLMQGAHSESAISIIERYMKLMDEYIELSRDNSIIYSIKYDFATYVLDSLIAYRENRKENQT